MTDLPLIPVLAMSEERVIAIVMVLVGVFAISGAAFDWDFFMNSRKARFLTRLIGRQGARIFYGLLGSAIVVVALLIVFGVLGPNDGGVPPS